MRNALYALVFALLLIDLSSGTALAEKKGVKEKTDFYPVRVIMEIDPTEYSMLAETEVKLWSSEPRGESFLMTIKITSETEIWMHGEKSTFDELAELNGKEVQIWGQIEVLYQEGKEKKYSWITMNVVPVYPEKKTRRKPETVFI